MTGFQFLYAARDYRERARVLEQWGHEAEAELLRQRARDCVKWWRT